MRKTVLLIAIWSKLGKWGCGNLTMDLYRICITLTQGREERGTVFSRLNAGGVYSKIGLVDPAFIRTRRLFIKCIFQYWEFIEPRTKFNENVKKL